jgi:hypothetical protein
LHPSYSNVLNLFAQVVCGHTRGRNESHEKQNNNNNTNKEIRKKYGIPVNGNRFLPLSPSNDLSCIIS